jgi:SAM-dependent methyltransferase
LRDIDRYENDYLENPFEGELIKFRHAKTLQFLDDYKARHVLEIGCGLVPLYEYYHAFESLTIVEPSSQFARQAEDAAPAGVKVLNELFNSDHLVPETGFDFIVISSLLHELEDPLALLLTVRGYAKPNTVVHINVPNARSMHRVLALRMGLIESLVEKSDRQLHYQQHHTFDVDSLKGLVTEAGFELLQVETFFIKPFTHIQMQTLMDDGLMDERMLKGLYSLSEDLPDMGAEIVANARLENP